MESVTKSGEIRQECHWCAANVGKIALWGNVVLFGVKLLCGSVGDSSAVVADAAHSAADLLLAIILMICLKISNSPPDKEHPYGRGNIEYIASLFVGVSLTTVAVLIAYTSLSDIMAGVDHRPTIAATGGLLISIVGNELMFRHSLCCGERFGSPAMIANAWENRADVYSSLAALIGVFGARLGLTILDPIAAVVVGFMIAKTGASTLMLGIQGMTDRSFDSNKLDKIRKVLLKQEGIQGLTRVRGRKIGQMDWIDVEAQFAPDISVSEVKETVVAAKREIMSRFDGIRDVVIVSQAAEPELKEA